MGNHDDSLLAGEIVDRIHDKLFRDAIERAGRFVQDDDGRVLQQRARDGDALLLSTRKLQPAFANADRPPGSLPCAESLCREVLSLPVYPEMTEEQIDYVISEARAHA